MRSLGAKLIARVVSQVIRIASDLIPISITEWIDFDHAYKDRSKYRNIEKHTTTLWAAGWWLHSQGGLL